jgi:hypothetical protein
MGLHAHLPGWAVRRLLPEAHSREGAEIVTKFREGPAAGVSLELRRAPKYLRVVCSQSTGWDALDQLDDTPKPEEKIYAYLLVEDRGSVFVDGRDKKGKRTGGLYRMAAYAYIESQPPDVVLRSTVQWREWCYAVEELAGAENSKPLPE